jgi:hypothetical protein
MRQELVRAPWIVTGNILEQYSLLELFMGEFEMKKGTQSTV